MLSWKKLVPLATGVALTLALFLIHTPEGLGREGQHALAVFMLALTLWLTHVIPLAATGLLAIGLIAVTDIMEPEQAFSNFGNSAVFFLLGVFLLTSAMMRTGLSKRLTLLFLGRFDRSPTFLLFGVLFTCSFLALWMPEHAVSAMIYPVVLETVQCLDLRPGESSYAKAIFIALAWGSIIGGVGTFLGGARAPLAVGLLYEAYAIRVGFLEWMLAAIPVVIIMTPLAFLVLITGFKVDIDTVTGARTFLREEIARIGPMSAAEKKMSVLMICTILGWIILGSRYSLATISIVSSVLIFVLGIARWRDIEEFVNWGVIVMYGGAIALGKALTETGAIEWLVHRYLPVGSWSPLAVMTFLVIIAIILTEGISNTAAVAVLVPLGFGLSRAMDINPLLVVLTVTIPAGLPFCMPIGSPPNAIAFSSGYYGISEVVRRGMLLNALSVLIIVLVIAFYWPLIGLF
jgi:sodium-dependent dicarboxylate transporter 2/3/5